MEPGRLNQFINVALAEKLAAMRTAEFFRKRARRGNVRKALKILARAGKKNPPRPGTSCHNDLKLQNEGSKPAALKAKAAARRTRDDP